MGGFDGEEDGTRFDGAVTSGFVGADVGRDALLAGVALSVHGGEGGYGFRVPRTRGLVTPYAGLSLGQDANQTWRTGARWLVAPEVALGLEASGGPAGEEDADNTLMLRAHAHF